MKAPQSVTSEQIRHFTGAYRQNPCLQAMTHALSKHSISDVTFVAESCPETIYAFSIDIPTLPATSQQSTGRCWLFAGLNLLREKAAKKYNLETFELSQNYTAFWDKFEKINYFLETILDLLDRPLEDRLLHYVLSIGIQDGGQWDMLAAVLKKYGAVPKSVMPETYQSSHTGDMNRLINTKLRQCAAQLREMHQNGADISCLRAKKEAALQELFQFLCTNFGVPPTCFDFEYKDKDGAYHIEKALTPQAFLEGFEDGLLEESVSLIHSPTRDKPFDQTYTVEYLGNVVEGDPVRYLNLTMEEMKQAIVCQLQAGEPVWFGSDVGKFGERDSGVWNDKAYDYSSAFSMDFSISKEQQLDYLDSAMNHAMVITGVSLDEAGTPTRWKIQNSWGEDHGEKGYYLMSASWFDRYVYQAVIRKKYLTAKQLAALETEASVLPPWDPMGTLALCASQANLAL